MPTEKNFNLKLEQYSLGELSKKEMKDIENNPENSEYM